MILKETERPRKNAVLRTFDVISLYPIIPHEEGLSSLRKHPLRISPYSVQMRDAGKMRTRLTPNMDTFYAVTLT